jgi:uncharacterized membrane protein
VGTAEVTAPFCCLRYFGVQYSKHSGRRTETVPDLTTAAALAVAALPVITLTSGAARIVFGLLFLLFLPGYSLVSALFPARRTLSTFERPVLSLASSFLLVAASGVLLDLTHFGIRLLPVVIFQSALVGILLPVAAVRRKRLAPEERFRVELCGKATGLKSFWANAPKCGKALNLALTGSAALAAGVLIFTAAGPQQGEVFSEFYILGAGGLADDYVQEIVLGKSGEVTVGVVNREQCAAVYSVKIFIEGHPAGEMKAFALKHEESYEAATAFTPQRTGRRRKIELQLFKDNVLYRSLHIWVDVINPGDSSP